ncbi:hypothetical protein PRK78_000757 [Emydomyces testavorans]|uniref:Fe2OG dioxygenase domain-containing protein n=1 Tax=Emydomyces testavorans TaxID=2070801 RepID=A0AAF0DBN9_9EURO|nr:hypothetical protein PRK78_000757 [Emydomyces testavorans]
MAYFLAAACPKLSFLARILRDVVIRDGAKVNVVFQWPATFWQARMFVEHLSLRAHLLHAGLKPDERKAIEDDWENKDSPVKVLLSTFVTGSTGINLHHACSRMVIMETPANVNTLLQTIGRLHRVGQTEPLTGATCRNLKFTKVKSKQHRIKLLPESAYYIPEFITPEEEEQLLNKITSVPLPRWTHLSRRRLQTWPSALTKSDTLLESPLPDWLISPVVTRFKILDVFSASPHRAPNHVLINEYQPGQGIMPHEDGAAYYPIVATVSIAAPIILDIYEKNSDSQPTMFMTNVNSETVTSRAPRYRILQEPRSLLITTRDLYTDYMHGIAERTSDDDLGPESICNWDQLGDKSPFEEGNYKRQIRISLTYRDVCRVSKLGNTMKFLNRR